MKKELAKNYDPQTVESDLYKNWLEKKYFHAEADRSRKPYCIVIPPPNITGQLHMGHALDNTIQDILIRWKRMSGYNALWMPGTDHASISTEVKIVEKMAAEGLKKEDIGREKFLERAWDWKNEYGNIIVGQLKKLGSSCDWDRERFTLDEGLSNAVLEVFVRLYEKGYIYRGEKLINWCPNCKTSISDAEVDHEDKEGIFYHFRYKINGEDDFIAFATTRPETVLGDTAVAVNPGDERYRAYLGKTVTVPVVNREIPIIADSYVDMEFGTGAVKITPAHDPNDFEIGERHGLPRVNVLNDDGTMNEKAGEYQGLTRKEARKRIVAHFKDAGLYVKEEKITHAVGVHERCADVVEPMLKTQWFVKMEEMAKPAIEVYKSGEMRIIPERFGKIYLHWLENIKDWCISRQLWWGHRIPAYYCGGCGHIEVAKTAPGGCSKCGGALRQDEDTLDTWFSSALWPFSTLGWPEQTEELKYFYPTSVLVTSYDILFFWVVRMVFSGFEHLNQRPFDDVLFHGLVRDGLGRKMSKSLGNGVDPLEVIQQYGADTLRLMLVTGNSMGHDLKFNSERLEPCRNFMNKIWNAARFILMNLDDDITEQPALTQTDKWILSRVNTIAKETTDNLNSYELGLAVQKVYDFIWDEFCDWYIEMVKPRLYDRGDPTRAAALWTLKTVLLDALRLAHPFMPFITEEIFLSIQDKEETIMRSAWPVYTEERRFEREEKAAGMLKDAIRGIRNLRTEMNVAPSRKSKVYVVCADADARAVFEDGKIFFKNMAFASETVVLETKPNERDLVPAVTGAAEIYMPFADLVDIEKERERLTKEHKRLEGEVARLEGRLGNPGFVSKAPAGLIAAEKEKLGTYTDMKTRVEEQLNALG
ncbi:MAG: valine--tRNA ligase [Defluviitaleaceae bacterium]|nr:valine--tRNA ligase [Defluviitaleaceae bacterium]